MVERGGMWEVGREGCRGLQGIAVVVVMVVVNRLHPFPPAGATSQVSPSSTDARRGKVASSPWRRCKGRSPMHCIVCISVLN